MQNSNALLFHVEMFINPNRGFARIRKIARINFYKLYY